MADRRKLLRGFAAEMNAALAKSNSAGQIGLGSDISYIDPERIQTGIVGLDVISSGGVPRGMMTQFWGDYSTAKTSTAFCVARAVQQYYEGTVAIASPEPLNKKWARKIGMKIAYSPEELEDIAEENPQRAKRLESIQDEWPDVAFLQHTHGDALLEMIYKAVKSNLFDLVIIDSLAAIKKYDTVEEKSMEDQSYGGEAALYDRFCGKMYSAFNTRYDEETMTPVTKLKKKQETVGNQTAVLALNQARVTIGGYNPTGRTQYHPKGGQALKHAWGLSVEFRKGPRMLDKRGDKKVVYALEVRAKCDKSKIGPPFREAEWDFYVEPHGDIPAGHIDMAKEVFQWGTFFELFERSGAYYTIEGTRVQGKEQAIDLLRENEELCEELMEQIIEEARRD